MDDAAVLAQFERTPTAFAVACFAADEYGKHILVTSFPDRDLEDDSEWNKLWRRFRVHEEKLGNALLHAWWDDLFDLSDPPMADDLHLARLRATYVDLDTDNGTVLEPREAVNEEQLGRLLDQLDRSVRRSETTFGGTSAARLAGIMRQISGSEDSDRLRQAMRSDPELMEVHVGALRARLLAQELGGDADEAESLWQKTWEATRDARRDRPDS